MELSESLEFGFGVDPVSGINPNSRLGKYITATGATTVRRTFSQTTDQSSAQRGEEKLVVAVSSSSWLEFLKNFSYTEVFFHHHYPQAGSFSWMFMGSLQEATVGSLLNPIVLN